jgi:hypothetical protein
MPNHLYIKCSILPSHARDKHHRKTQQKEAFSYRSCFFLWSGDACAELLSLALYGEVAEPAGDCVEG